MQIIMREVKFMAKLTLNAAETAKLNSMISKAEKENNNSQYAYDPGFSAYSCSCTAHKKSCGWD